MHCAARRKKLEGSLRDLEGELRVIWIGTRHRVTATKQYSCTAVYRTAVDGSSADRLLAAACAAAAAASSLQSLGGGIQQQAIKILTRSTTCSS
jgi:hypothetical protein